jgi:DedD protein
LIPRGSILLQVSAMTKESDALAMAQQLQQKKFPTIVIPPGADKFYHVQVGPYADAKSADAARAALEKAGFKTIVKR